MDLGTDGPTGSDVETPSLTTDTVGSSQPIQPRVRAASSSSIADGQREVVGLDPTEYSELWQDIGDTGWLAFAMEGRQGDFHLGRETAKEEPVLRGRCRPSGKTISPGFL